MWFTKVANHFNVVQQTISKRYQNMCFQSPGIEVGCPWLDQVGEAEGQVSGSDDHVGPDGGMGRLLQDGEEQLEVAVTESGAAGWGGGGGDGGG